MLFPKCFRWFGKKLSVYCDTKWRTAVRSHPSPMVLAWLRQNVQHNLPLSTRGGIGEEIRKWGSPQEGGKADDCVTVTACQIGLGTMFVCCRWRTIVPQYPVTNTFFSQVWRTTKMNETSKTVGLIRALVTMCAQKPGERRPQKWTWKKSLEIPTVLLLLQGRLGKKMCFS